VRGSLAHGRAASHLERLHDVRLVRAPAIQERPALARHRPSWLIAFAEYCFRVPANRIGYGRFTAAELKRIQEAITLVVFSVVSIFCLKKQFRWNYAVGFAMILGATVVIFKKW